MITDLRKTLVYKHNTFMKGLQHHLTSFFQSKQSSPARSVSSSSHSEYSVSSTRNYLQHHSTSTSTANGRMITSTGPPSSSSTTTTTSIPLPSNSSTSSSSSVASSTNGLKYVGKLPVSQASTSHQKLPQPVTFTARRDAEKSASADAHINQLRMVRSVSSVKRSSLSSVKRSVSDSSSSRDPLNLFQRYFWNGIYQMTTR